MKRMTFMFLALALVATLTLTGCKEKLKQSRGIVTAMEMSGDTLLNMRVAVQGGDTLVFKLDDANFNRGIAMHGDSVLVNHLSGPGDTLRAIIVTVMPKPVHYFVPDTTSDKPLTVPAEVKNQK